jgi:hypothetical protein
VPGTHLTATIGVDPIADPYEPYQGTRRFYEAVGFEYMLDADPDNPMTYYLKQPSTTSLRRADPAPMR